MQLKLGDDPLDMVVELVRDQAFVDQLELRAGKGNAQGVAPGTPIPWPVETKCWMTIANKGSHLKQTWPIRVDGSFLYIDVPAEQVQLVSREAAAKLWLEYPAETYAKPFVWASGRVAWRG